MFKLRSVIVLTILFMVLGYLTTEYSIGLDHLSEITGGVGPLDTEEYQSGDIQPRLLAIGEEGRSFYKTVLLTSDMFFPILYRVMLVSIISFSLSTFINKRNRLKLISLLPLISMFLDIIENLSLVFIISSYPKSSSFIESLLPWLTRLKWSFNYVDWGVTGLTVITAIVLKFTLKGKKI